MNRTVAILLTAFTTFFCGLPGLGIICLGTMGAIGSQMPGYESQDNTPPESLALGFAIILCFGATLLLFPIIVGFFSYRLNRLSEAFTDLNNPPSLPPDF
jgi:hypothetical protein